MIAPMHWIPATREFLDATLAGIGWGMNPLCLVKDMLADGRLIDLSPGKHVDVALYWQCARIGGKLLDALTKEVVAAARRGLMTRKARASEALSLGEFGAREQRSSGTRSS